mmetsp:Transcript_54193/g.116338  ORF Transcript_54193/g.116338 Transcript_54193/m.116338 type:complete len:272 (-) Transcript_54193:8-823(-)
MPRHRATLCAVATLPQGGARRSCRAHGGWMRGHRRLHRAAQGLLFRGGRDDINCRSRSWRLRCLRSGRRSGRSSGRSSSRGSGRSSGRCLPSGLCSGGHFRDAGGADSRHLLLSHHLQLGLAWDSARRHLLPSLHRHAGHLCNELYTPVVSGGGLAHQPRRSHSRATKERSQQKPNRNEPCCAVASAAASVAAAMGDRELWGCSPYMCRRTRGRALSIFSLPRGEERLRLLFVLHRLSQRQRDSATEEGVRRHWGSSSATQVARTLQAATA